MQFSIVAVLAAASVAQAASYGYPAPGNVTYTTEVVTAYTTYCPEPTTITHGDNTYTITEATTLTITDCPCTISKPVLTSSVVECHDCAKPTTYPTPPAPPAANSSVPVVPIPSASAPAEAGAAKFAAAGMAALLGAAAFVL